jgi:hypothetical protein
MHATRYPLHLAAGQEQQTPRDRPSEFATTVDGAEPLLLLIDQFSADCSAVHDRAGSIGRSQIRRRKRSTGKVVEISAAYASIQAVTHLRDHADEATATHHLSMARPTEAAGLGRPRRQRLRGRRCSR